MPGLPRGPTATGGAVSEPRKPEDTLPGPVSEYFFSFEQLFVAALDLGLLSRAGSTWTDVIGTMTGLNMTKYELVPDLDRYGWRLVRRSAEP